MIQNDKNKLKIFPAILPNNENPIVISNNEKANKLNIQFLKDRSEDFFSKPPELPKLLTILDENNAEQAFMLKGVVGAIIGAGGIGKTTFLHQLALACSTNVKFLNHFSIADNKQLNVLQLFGEDDDNQIQNLFYKTTQCMFKDNKAKIKEANSHLALKSLKGQVASFLNRNDETTTFYDDLLGSLIYTEPIDGWDLIIIDPASRFLGPNAEKDNYVATLFVSLLENIIMQLRGKPTILYSHHMNKYSIGANTNQSASRGASGLTDGIRWQSNLDQAEDTNNQIYFHCVKTNYTRKFAKKILEQDEHGCFKYLKDDNNSKNKSPKKKEEKELSDWYSK